MEIQSANRQHPVPQNVMDVEFKLIGELTIRQFSYLVVFGILFLITYKSPLPFLFRIPLLIIEVLAGISFAFLPYNDITLDKWTVNYIKAITSPRIRIWKHVPTIPYFFTYIPKKSTKKEKLKEYTTNDKNKSKSIQELFNKNYNNSIPFEDDSDITQQEIAYLQKIGFKKSIDNKTNIKGETIIPDKLVSKEKVQKELIKDELSMKKSLVQTTLTAKTETHNNNTQLNKNIKQAFNIALVEQKNRKTPKTVKKVGDAPKKQEQNEGEKEHYKEKQHSIFNIIEKWAHKKQGEQEKDALMENKKTKNKQLTKLVSGKVVATSGELVPNAVVIFKDIEQNPRIAVKTNQVGEFKTTTPLEYGKYIIEVIKEGYKFKNKNIKIDENLIEPINLIGTKV